MLAQAELFTLAPTRKLLVRPGDTAWWGVDSSTKQVAIATVQSDGNRDSTIVSVARLEGARRLAAIFCATAQAVADLLQRGEPPGLVVVEEAAGFGKRPNPELAYAVGAVMTALAIALPHARIETVVGSKWKLRVCGYGGIKKPKPGSREPYAVLQWARSVGYEGSSWDEADAWAIAEFGHRTVLLEQR